MGLRGFYSVKTKNAREPEKGLKRGLKENEED